MDRYNSVWIRPSDEAETVEYDYLNYYHMTPIPPITEEEI